MGTPHKHAALIKAWADGAEIEVRYPSCRGGWTNWKGSTNPTWNPELEYRIKPHKYQEVIDAWKEGKDIQFKTDQVPIWCDARKYTSENNPLPFDTYPSWEWRIKPPTKKYRLYLYKAMIGYVIGIVEGYQTFNPENMDCFVRWVTDWQEIEIE
jgi:hypothetical protein